MLTLGVEIAATLRRGDRLLRAALGGAARQTAYLDDYAFLVEGILAIYEATNDEKWLNAAEIGRAHV